MTTLTRPSIIPDLGLESVVRAWAADPAAWRHLVYFDEPRVRIPLYAGVDYEVRLLTWLPGQGSGLHDHGGSAGCMLVVEGSLWESVADDDGFLHESRVDAGTASSFRDDIVHTVHNRGLVGAVSIHAYRPALTEMQRYHVVDGRVVRLQAD